MELPGYKEDDRSPRFSISALIQRGADMSVLLRQDNEELTRIGLDTNSMSDEIGVLVKECSMIVAEWRVEWESTVQESSDLNTYYAECRKFRNMVHLQLRAANALNPNLFNLVPYAKSPSRAHLVQDLWDLSFLFRTYPEIIKKTAIDPHLGELAHERSNTLSMRIANLEARRFECRDFKQKRNIMLNKLYFMIEEVCAAGRFVFHNDPRIQNYAFKLIR